MEFQRITVNPEICAGKPVIRGLRFPVSRLLGLLASGETRESILKAYPYLEQEDIQEALNYAWELPSPASQTVGKTVSSFSQSLLALDYRPEEG